MVNILNHAKPRMLNDCLNDDPPVIYYVVR